MFKMLWREVVSCANNINCRRHRDLPYHLLTSISMAIAGDGAAGNIFFAEVKRPFVCSACVCRTRWCRGCVCTDYGVGVGVADRAHEFIFSLSLAHSRHTHPISLCYSLSHSLAQIKKGNKIFRFIFILPSFRLSPFLVGTLCLS